MTALSLQPTSSEPAIVAELRRRNAALTSAGLFCLAAAAVLFALPLVDGRTLGGVAVWMKPAKFFLSVAVFLLTSAWFFGFVAPERRTAPRLVWSVRIALASAAFELVYITLQAARGEASHFNTADPLHIALYAAMGVVATVLLLTKVPLALEIARRPAVGADPDMRFAVVLGLWMTVVLGGFAGLYMGAQAGHAVGAEAGHLPLFGWNRLGGDLRVAHFFGMHAEQAVPAAAALLAALGAPARRRLIAVFAAGLAAVVLFAFAQAVAGRPFPLG